MAIYVNQTDYQLILDYTRFGESLTAENIEITLTKPDGNKVNTLTFVVEGDYIKWSPENKDTFNRAGVYKFTISVDTGLELPADPIEIEVENR